MALEQPYKEQTIREALRAIQRRELVLPAIQREFIWDDEQVCWLFDSLLCGFPFGTFLFWMVNPENTQSYKWYDFILHWHEKNAPHNAVVAPLPGEPVTAVLDGQQRLTALNIGLRGSMAWRLQGKWWRLDENFPVRHLHLNLREHLDEESDTKYQFRFIRDDMRHSMRHSPSEREHWFRVSEVMTLGSGQAVREHLRNRGLPDDGYATAALERLRAVVHEERLILAYVEKDQEHERALHIFNRLNSGGTPLSFSDLLLSVIVAQVEELRDDVIEFVDRLNRVGSGFNFTKDFVLKAGLMLLDVNVGFKVANFKRENAEKLAGDWKDIKASLLLTARLVSGGFNLGRDNLRTSSALLPIAYYLHLIEAGDSYLKSRHTAGDRLAIRTWLMRSLFKPGFWRGGVDTVLTALRAIIRENGTQGFPLHNICEGMRDRGRPLDFDSAEIDSLAGMTFGDSRTFMLLSLLQPVDLSANRYHTDHIFPVAAFTDEAVPEDRHEEYWDKMNRLPNLQLLDEQENKEKGAKLPKEWLDNKDFSLVGGRPKYVAERLLEGVPADLAGFGDFYDCRREGLRKRIIDLLGVSE